MHIGIDLGGSHIGIGAVTPDGKIQKLFEKNITSSDKNNIEEFILINIVNTLKKWITEDKLSIDKIGIGVPGIVENDIAMHSVNLEIENFDLKSKLQSVFPTVEIHIKNDAKCAALAEKKFGILKDTNDCVYICIGTGIGGAVFYNGELITPKRSSGFEFGHMVIQKDGEQCKCGKNGCFEVYGSMRKLKKDLKAVLNINRSVEGNELLNIIKENISNYKVTKIINDYIKSLCIGISNIINILEPQTICIGGGFVYYDDILLKKLKNELYNSKYIFYKKNIPEIVTAKLGNYAGIIGGALCI